MSTFKFTKTLDGLSLCVSIGLFLGVFCGAILVLVGRMHGHAHEITDPWWLALALGFGAALLGGFIVILKFGAYVPTLLFVFAIAMAVAFLLVALIVAFPMLQPVATVPGALIGLALGKLACLACRRGKVAHA